MSSHIIDKLCKSLLFRRFKDFIHLEKFDLEDVSSLVEEGYNELDKEKELNHET